MNPELKALTIPAKELEELTGFEVNELFIGSLLGGAYRSGIFKSSKRLLSFCLTQLVLSALIVIFTLPLGLIVIRNDVKSISDTPTISRFLQITLGVSFIVFAGWNLSMGLKGRTLKSLVRLLDEVDKYNDVVQAVSVLDRLEVTGISTQTISQKQTIKALAIARNSLVYGLMSEKILRQSRSLLANRADLLHNIETNLATLRALEVNDQATEYVELLNEALKIGMSVQQEIQQLSRS